MITRRILTFMLLTLIAFGANVMMAQELPPIPVDDAVRIGKLDCGLPGAHGL